jgi:glutamate-1-semialdehyde 2,1-aminomutase
VLGKPIAGGVPAAVYGVSQSFADRIEVYLAGCAPGRSGIGSTLSGSKLQLALMRAVLENYFTEEAFAPLIVLARRLEKGIADVIIKYGVAWHVMRVGARVEFMCCPNPPRNGGEAAQVIHRPIDMAVHNFLLNRGVVITPFHNMMLICPATRQTHIDRLLAVLDACLGELLS